MVIAEPPPRPSWEWIAKREEERARWHKWLRKRLDKFSDGNYAALVRVSDRK